jgi:hypothetical protein
LAGGLQLKPTAVDGSKCILKIWISSFIIVVNGKSPRIVGDKSSSI